jgi:hypothetical protein
MRQWGNEAMGQWGNGEIMELRRWLSRVASLVVATLVLVAVGRLSALRATTPGRDVQTRRDREAAALSVLERVSSQPFGIPAPEVETACDTLRTGTPTAFEREWMIASAGVLARSGCFFPTDAARWHIDHALSRFPDDPSLQLARVMMRPEGYTVSNRPGLSNEYLSHSEGMGRMGLGAPFVVRPHSYPPNARTIPESVRELQRLSQDQDVGDEALARLATLHFVMGRIDQAIENNLRDQGAPVFRATSAGVVVDVSVRAGRNPVRDLGPADFELRDNGVLQSVQTLSVGAVLRGIAGQLASTDRLRVLVANVRPHEAVPMTSISTLSPDALDLDSRGFSWWSGTITSSLYDATAAALIEPVPTDRRSLVLVFTNGIDGVSVLTPELFQALAKQSEALVHVARFDTAGEYFRRRNPRSTDIDTRRLQWPKNTEVIENVARATGGTARHLGDSDSMVDIFRRILDEFRQSYVLRYQPAGVTAAGWHQISVRVTRRGNYDVRARRGYFGG